MSFNPRIFGADATAATATLLPLLQVTTKAARLYSVRIYNTSANTYFLQFHDTATTPGAGAVPKFQMKFLADQFGGDDFPDGFIFKNGVFIGVSTVNTGYTASAANDCIIAADYSARGFGN